MFSNIRKCLDKLEEVLEKCHVSSQLTEDEKDIFEYFKLHFAEAIMKDFYYDDKGEKVAKIILATLE